MHEVIKIMLFTLTTFKSAMDKSFWNFLSVPKEFAELVTLIVTALCVITENCDIITGDLCTNIQS
jgi:hypothetical protein